MVAVPLAEAPYDVVIGAGLLDEAGERIRAISAARKIALVTDSAVGSLYALRVDSLLARAGFEVISMAVPAGEGSKSWGRAGELLEAFAAAGLGREDLVVALGGGVVGDLAGFAAAVYLRGVSFIQLPTTLLAMVDSSVGGKTAVDLAAGKNLAGAFKQPLVVIADTATLRTLPEHEWKSGMAEAAKSAVIDGEEFLGWMERTSGELHDGTSAEADELVRRCVAFKAGIVSVDEKEEGPRECLNYGHTLGHAIEKVAGYGSVTHGAAVAEGMRFAARVSADVAGTDLEFVRRQDRLLDALGLDALDIRLPAEALLEAMHGDKKARGGVVRMVLASSPGQWSCAPVADEIVRAHLKQWAATKGGDNR